MMEKSLHFLPLFFREPVYVVDEPESFVVEPAAAATTAQPEPAAPALAFSGENRRQIMVLADHEADDFLSSAEGTLLQKILRAVQLTTTDIALVNVRKCGLDATLLPEAIENFPFQTLISFGVYDPSWPFSHYFTKYAVANDNAGRKFLFGNALHELANDPQQKLKLWQCLQQLFVP